MAGKTCGELRKLCREKRCVGLGSQGRVGFGCRLASRPPLPDHMLFDLPLKEARELCVQSFRTGPFILPGAGQLRLECHPCRRTRWASRDASYRETMARLKNRTRPTLSRDEQITDEATPMTVPSSRLTQYT